MAEEYRTGWHWETVALWLTGISVMQGLIAAYVSMTTAGQEPVAFRAMILGTNAAAWLAVLWNISWASTTVFKKETPYEKRKAALKTAWGCGVAATAMVTAVMTAIVWAFI